MADLIVRDEEGREIQISKGEFIFLKDSEGEVNWDWQYIDEIQSQIETMLKEAAKYIDQVKELLPDIPMGRLK